MNDGLQPPQPLAPALAYHDRPGLPGLVLKNLFLNLVTLWFYRFWAKTRWRRHIWSNVSLLGDPIEYTGTGPEKFKGFLVALAFLAPFFIVFGVWEAMVEGNAVWFTIEQIVYFATLYILIVAASFYARRYRLSRTRWRGTALVLDAKFGDYLKFHLRTQALNALTLFVMNPRATMAIEAWLISRTRLGGATFVCAPDWRSLMGKWLLFVASTAAFAILGWGWLAGILGGGIANFGLPRVHGGIVVLLALFAPCAFIAYRVARIRTTIDGTTLQGASFRCLAVIGSFIMQLFFALLACLVMIGIVGALFANASVSHGVVGGIAGIVVYSLVRDAWIAPWIVGHIVGTVSISNPEALAAIAAGTEDDLTRGEGLADSFDVGIG